MPTATLHSGLFNSKSTTEPATKVPIHAHQPTNSALPNLMSITATVKSIELAAFMDQAGSDYVLAERVLHAGSIVLTHAVIHWALLVTTSVPTLALLRAGIISPQCCVKGGWSHGWRWRCSSDVSRVT